MHDRLMCPTCDEYTLPDPETDFGLRHLIELNRQVNVLMRYSMAIYGPEMVREVMWEENLKAGIPPSETLEGKGPCVCKYAPP